MNDDLDLKGAFDGVSKNLKRLKSLKTKGEFGNGDAEELHRTLNSIDGVLQVFGF